MSLDWHVSKAQAKLHALFWVGQSVWVEVKSWPRAAASLELRQLAQPSASLG
jgi:hypothetical protein